MMKVGFEVVPLDKVRNNSYILVGSRYRDRNSTSKYDISFFSEIATLTRGVNYQKSQQTTFRTNNICCGEYDGYDNPKDVIAEQMIQSFKLSVNELLVCNEMSVSSLITEHRGYQAKLKDFKKAISDHCQEMGYI